MSKDSASSKQEDQDQDNDDFVDPVAALHVPKSQSMNNIPTQKNINLPPNPGNKITKEDYKRETQSFLKRGTMNTDHLLYILKSKNSVTEIDKKNKILIDILCRQVVDINEEENQNLAIYILRRQKKNVLELKFLQGIIGNLSIFKENQDILEEQNNQNIYQQLKIEYHDKHSVIFNAGDTGNRFYIILKGSVHVLKENEKKKSIFNFQAPSTTTIEKQLKKQDAQKNKVSNSKPAKKTHNQNNQIYQESYDSQSSEDSQNEDLDKLNDQQFLKTKFPDFQRVVTLGPGNSFGEIALITQDCQRTATVVTQQNTFFMTLHREGFNKVLGAYKESLMKNQVKFLMNFPFLKRIPKEKILQLILHDMVLVKFNSNHVVYNEGEPADKIYFIYKGEVEFFKLPTEDGHHKSKKLRELQPHENSQEFSKTFISFKSKRSVKYASMCILGPQNYFGEEEIIHGHKKRQSKVVVKSVDSEIYTVPFYLLYEYLDNYQQFKDLKEDSIMKSKYHSNRLINIFKVQQQEQKQLTQLQLQIAEQLFPKIQPQSVTIPYFNLQQSVSQSLPLQQQIQQQQLQQNKSFSNDLQSIQLEIQRNPPLPGKNAENSIKQMLSFQQIFSQQSINLNNKSNHNNTTNYYFQSNKLESLKKGKSNSISMKHSQINIMTLQKENTNDSEQINQNQIQQQHQLLSEDQFLQTKKSPKHSISMTNFQFTQNISHNYKESLKQQKEFLKNSILNKINGTCGFSIKKQKLKGITSNQSKHQKFNSLDFEMEFSKLKTYLSNADTAEKNQQTTETNEISLKQKSIKTENKLFSLNRKDNLDKWNTNKKQYLLQPSHQRYPSDFQHNVHTPPSFEDISISQTSPQQKWQEMIKKKKFEQQQNQKSIFDVILNCERRKRKKIPLFYKSITLATKKD